MRLFEISRKTETGKAGKKCGEILAWGDLLSIRRWEIGEIGIEIGIGETEKRRELENHPFGSHTRTAHAGREDKKVNTGSTNCEL